MPKGVYHRNGNKPFMMQIQDAKDFPIPVKSKRAARMQTGEMFKQLKMQQTFAIPASTDAKYRAKMLDKIKKRSYYYTTILKGKPKFVVSPFKEKGGQHTIRVWRIA